MSRGKLGKFGNRREPSGGALGYVLIVAALLVIGGIIYLRIAVAEGPGIDQATLCPLDGPTERIAIVVDMTDPVSAVVRAQAAAELDREISALPPGARIDLSLVKPQSDGFEKDIVSLCRPGDPSAANPLYENPRLVAEQFEQKFSAPLDARLKQLLGAPSADRSPILETIQAAATVAFGADRTTPRRLIVVSDLIQHSDALSFYRGQDWDAFAASAAHRRVGRMLDGVEVLLLHLPRENVKPGVYETSLTFWRTYFDEQGVSRLSRRALGDL